MNGADAIPEHGGLFKAHILGGLFHLLLQSGLQLLAFALQHLDALADDLAEGLGRQLAGAGAAAFFHVQLQAGPFLSDIPWEFPAAAGQQKGLTQQADGHIGGAPAAVGAEIQRAVLLPAAGQRQAGKLLPADPDKGIALVILQQDVVLGLVFFDQGVFQQQGVQLGVGENGLKMVDIGHHPPGLQGVRSQIGKILAHPVAERLGLAHIDDCAVAVVHEINAGQLGQPVGFFFQFFKCHEKTLLPADSKNAPR